MKMIGESCTVTRTYLEMTDPAEFEPAYRSDITPVIARAERCPASFYRYLYREVGRRYHWVERLDWTDDQILEHLRQPSLSLWVMYVDGSPAGYFELQREEDCSIEVAYFGLLPEFIGAGLGKHLLSFGVQRAWDDGACRVWLHTCTLDDPAALPNYLKRGFKPYKQETYVTTIGPDETLAVR